MAGFGGCKYVHFFKNNLFISPIILLLGILPGGFYIWDNYEKTVLLPIFIKLQFACGNLY